MESVDWNEICQVNAGNPLCSMNPSFELNLERRLESHFVFFYLSFCQKKSCDISILEFIWTLLWPLTNPLTKWDGPGHPKRKPDRLQNRCLLGLFEEAMALEDGSFGGTRLVVRNSFLELQSAEPGLKRTQSEPCFFRDESDVSITTVKKAPEPARCEEHEAAEDCAPPDRCVKCGRLGLAFQSTRGASSAHDDLQSGQGAAPAAKPKVCVQNSRKKKKASIFRSARLLVSGRAASQLVWKLVVPWFLSDIGAMKDH